ncbi:RNA polymerase subunit sigma-70 [Salmonella enterica]
MNQSEFARLHGVSRKTVTQWKARGWLVLEGDDIDVDASNANIERYRKTVSRPGKKNAKGNNQGYRKGNTGRGNRQGNITVSEWPESPGKVAERILVARGAEMTLDEARQMKENYLALLTQLEYDTKSGALLPFDEMISEVRKEYSRMRTRLVAIAPEHGPRLRVLAPTVSDAEFVQALQEVVYEAMEELSSDTDSRRGDQQ